MDNVTSLYIYAYTFCTQGQMVLGLGSGVKEKVGGIGFYNLCKLITSLTQRTQYLLKYFLPSILFLYQTQQFCVSPSSVPFIHFLFPTSFFFPSIPPSFLSYLFIFPPLHFLSCLFAWFILFPLCTYALLVCLSVGF